MVGTDLVEPVLRIRWVLEVLVLWVKCKEGCGCGCMCAWEGWAPT